MKNSDLSVEIAQQIIEIRQSSGCLTIRGAASKPWMASHRSHAATELDLRPHKGIVNYEPTELVVTVRAGTPLADLDAALAERGQMLAAECPNFGGASTIGGALALGWSGPRGAYAGDLRGLVLGLQLVNGQGEILNFGGQVMKNVAGFDISRLICGSAGRLGAILEASLRVMPRPETEQTWRRTVATLDEALTSERELRKAGQPISAAVYDGTYLFLRLSGRAAALSALPSRAGWSEEADDIWTSLREWRHPALVDPAKCVRSPGIRSDDLEAAEAFLVDLGSDISYLKSTTAGPAMDRHSPRPKHPALFERLSRAFDPDGLFNTNRELN